MSELQQKAAFRSAIEQGNQAVINKEFHQAINHFQQALPFKPKSAKLRAKLSFLCLQLNQFKQALQYANAAIQLRPELAAAHSNYADSLFALNQVDKSIDSCRNAIECDPTVAVGHYALATKLLLTEQFDEGWNEYEWRLALDSALIPTPAIARWDGSDLNNQNLLVIAEQGLGDTLQFIRYVKLLKSTYNSLHITVQCQEQLQEILQAIPEIDELVTRIPPDNSCDCYVPLLSLPGLLQTTKASIPQFENYLTIDEEAVETWKQRMSDLQPFKVGLCWQGNPNHVLDSRRSIQLQSFEALFEHQDIGWISLQKGAGTEQLQGSLGVNLVNYGSDISNFIDTAACMMNCDLIISVDSALCHLAGALGKPVWTLLHTPGDWRWFRHDDTTPWYPSMRLFRQETPLDWTPVMQRLKQELIRAKADSAKRAKVPSKLPRPAAPINHSDQYEANLPIASQTTATLHYKVIELWHQHEPKIACWDDARELLIHDSIIHNPERLILKIAVMNTFQWHEEDKARIPSATDELLARVKKSIDISNQRRVDTIEELDLWIDQWLEQQNICPSNNIPINSETVGSLIDRLSILRLKIYHMKEETQRSDAAAQHIEKCRAKLAILYHQEQDLDSCLSELVIDLVDATKRHQVYYQHKMYNDPETNPQIYK